MPNVELISSADVYVELRIYMQDLAVIYFYADGAEIEGGPADAALHVGFRRYHDSLTALGVRVVAVGTGPPSDLAEIRRKGDLRHELLTDPGLRLAKALSLPTTKCVDSNVYQRLVLVAVRTHVRWVIYPVTDPESIASRVLTWVQVHGQ